MRRDQRNDEIRREKRSERGIGGGQSDKEDRKGKV